MTDGELASGYVGDVESAWEGGFVAGATALDQARATNRRLNRRIGELERALRVAEGEAKMLRDTCPYRAALEGVAAIPLGEVDMHEGEAAVAMRRIAVDALNENNGSAS
jgi:hypothetical protein